MADNAGAGTGYDAAAAADAYDFKLYRYTPSLPAAVVFVIVFTVLSVLHTWKLMKHRAYYFTAFTLGGYFQVLGYSGRIWSHFDTLAIGGFVMQAILILVAPALYAASVYMILGRLVRRLRAEGMLLLPAAWVTKIFVAGDVVSFTMQAGGGGVQAAGTLELYEMGEKIIIAGLFVQIAFFGFFLAAAVLFYLRYARGPGSASAAARSSSSSAYAALSIDSSDPFRAVPWRRHLWVLFAVSALILVRSVFRVIEYLQGNKGYLIAHEVFLYIFDAVLMALVMAVFLVWYVDDLDSDKEPDFCLEEAR